MKFQIVMGFGGPGLIPGESMRFVALGHSFLRSEEAAGLLGSVTFMSTNMAAMRTKPKLDIVTWHSSHRVTYVYTT